MKGSVFMEVDHIDLKLPALAHRQGWHGSG